MTMLNNAATTAFASRRKPALAGRAKPTVPRIGAAITAHRKIRNPSSTSSEAVRSNRANMIADSRAMKPAPIAPCPWCPEGTGTPRGPRTESAPRPSSTAGSCFTIAVSLGGLLELSRFLPGQRPGVVQRRTVFLAVVLSADPSTRAASCGRAWSAAVSLARDRRRPMVLARLLVRNGHWSGGDLWEGGPTAS